MLPSSINFYYHFYYFVQFKMFSPVNLLKFTLTLYFLFISLLCCEIYDIFLQLIYYIWKSSNNYYYFYSIVQCKIFSLINLLHFTFIHKSFPYNIYSLVQSTIISQNYSNTISPVHKYDILTPRIYYFLPLAVKVFFLFLLSCAIYVTFLQLIY